MSSWNPKQVLCCDNQLLADKNALGLMFVSLLLRSTYKCLKTVRSLISPKRMQMRAEASSTNVWRRTNGWVLLFVSLPSISVRPRLQAIDTNVVNGCNKTDATIYEQHLTVEDIYFTVKTCNILLVCSECHLWCLIAWMQQIIRFSHYAEKKITAWCRWHCFKAFVRRKLIRSKLARQICMPSSGILRFEQR